MSPVTRHQKKTMDTNNNDYQWISFSDVMTALMVIFMFIAISYMLQVQQEKQVIDDVFQEYIGTKQELRADLDSTFKDFFKKWDDVYLDQKDLSIKFQNHKVLFKSGEYALSDTFTIMLDEFLPKYLDIVNRDKYNEKIAEVRIEGHTDDTPIGGKQDPYIGNLQLSQDRSTSVMDYLIHHNAYNHYPQKRKEWMQFHFVSNGYSYGKTLDSNGIYSFESGNTIKNELSRRVEFRIVTQSERLIQEVMRRMNE